MIIWSYAMVTMPQIYIYFRPLAATVNNTGQLYHYGAINPSMPHIYISTLQMLLIHTLHNFAHFLATAMRLDLGVLM